MAPRTPDVPPEQHPADETAQLLVVEDNIEILTLMEDLLGELGNVATATDAEAALRHIRSTDFDLILLDIHLGPGAHGTDVLRMLRAHPGTRGVPMVAVTAYALSRDRDHLLEAGFDAYLSKPFEADELLALAARLLREREAK